MLEVFGSFPLVFGLVSYPPGAILESVFLWRVSVDRNLLVNVFRTLFGSAKSKIFDRILKCVLGPWVQQSVWSYKSSVWDRFVSQIFDFRWES